MNTNKGFTLIELLVVIAIIGVLASVVTAGLMGARNKNSDAAAKEALKNAITQSELYYQANSFSYTNVCSSGASALGVNSIYKIVENAAKSENLNSIGVNNSPAASTTTGTCNEAGGKWAAEVPLKAGGMFCVDSTGFVGPRVNSILNTVICPTS